MVPMSRYCQLYLLRINVETMPPLKEDMSKELLALARSLIIID